MKFLKKLTSRGFGHFELFTAVLVIAFVGVIGGYVYAHIHSHADNPNWTILASSGSGNTALTIQACQTYENSIYGGVYTVSIHYWKPASWSGSYGYTVYNGSSSTVSSTNSSSSYYYGAVGGSTAIASAAAKDHLSVYENTNNGDISNSNVNPGSLVSCSPGSSLGSMYPPSYSGSTWTSSDRSFDDTFKNLNNWNYGITGQGGNCIPWYETGNAPDAGSAGSPQNMLSYFLPGNVSQTSTGASTANYTTYTPQTFNSSGSGVTITAHYTGQKTYAGETYSWSSGSLNTCGKETFPASGDTQVYVQIKAQMMGYKGTDNGAWNALWFLGEANQQEIDLEETGLNQTNANLPTWVNSTLHSSAGDAQDTIANYNSGEDLSAGYHIYGLELNTATGDINVYLDNSLIGSVNASSLGYGSLTGPWFIILEGTIGSGRYTVAPTSNVDMNMNIADVQIYQR